MRLGEGATIRVSVPLHVVNGETSPGVKRGGTVNIVTHTIDLECSVDNIPQYIEADVGTLEISHSLHLSEIKLPTGVKSLSREDATLVTIVPPSGYAEELKACGGCRCGHGCSGGGCCSPAVRRLLPRRVPSGGWRESAGGWRESAGWRRQEEVSGRQDAAPCACLSVSVTPVRNSRTTGTISGSWPSMKLRGVTVSHRGAAVFRARLPKARSIAKRSFCFGRPPT